MDTPKMFDPYPAADDIFVLPSYFPIPGLGILPINAFVLKGREPVLVDTGLVRLSDQFIANLSSIIDPGDLRWLFLTHTDPDHIGNLQPLFDLAPKLRVITTFLALGKMSLFRPLPMERIYLLNPGQTLQAGDRTLAVVKPPTYDAPETTGFYDVKASVFFSADSFGALMSEPASDAAAIGRERLREGLLLWTTVDSPWLRQIDRNAYAETLGGIRSAAPKTVLSSHLPAAHNMTEELLDLLAEVPGQKPFVGPDQQTLDTMLKGRAAA